MEAKMLDSLENMASILSMATLSANYTVANYLFSRVKALRYSTASMSRVRNQKKLTLEAERNALTHWKVFVAACRQKRRWEHYVQQLHRSQTRSKAITLDQKRQVGGTFRHSRALQAQLKRNRILMTHVLHAWYLAVQNRRRRSLKRLHRSRPISKARQIALEFWARRVMDKCFLIWREQSLGKLAEMA
ncbi:hypothetical protein F441_12998 [Phytophthora nicotianae CJ01A1]|uniref:Sfi1 spindle body domain-containing protein n=2 Tax=Phytophthora nicotianae TaxID=4792 RepID=W2YWU7_PHYNI|nr:hypothetical protein F441_12998 [Phytophthora nicotianae CJ01A1]ETP39617.1 hypothetical protein F442_12930 [Phytophthora nicotianae P10297]